MQRSRKIFYIGFIGLLTSTAMTGCYWQTNRYFQSKKRWQVIAKQLSQKKPKNISQLTQQQIQNLYSFKYLEFDGKISTDYIKIKRPKGLRLGYLVLKKLTYKFNDENKQIIALQGWCPQTFQLKQKKTLQKEQHKKVKGILRQKQKTDYVHQKMKQEDLQKYKMNTWIDLKKYIKQLNMKKDQLNQNFYLEILRQEELADNDDEYPYQYRVDNFQLPYLTPDTHRGYATFWGTTSLVGWFAIFKVLRMK